MRRTAAILASSLALAAGCSGATVGETAPPPVTATTVTTAAVPTTAAVTTAVPTAVDTTPSSATTTVAPGTTAPTPVVAVAPNDPVALAAAVAAAERTIRDPTASPAAVADAGRLQQLLYRRWVGHPEWDASVLAAVPADLRAAAERNATARRPALDAARRRAEPPSPTIPAWTIVEPRPPDELVGYYREAEAATGVAWEYLAAINLQETRMGRIVGLSSAGARGPMQFLPSTWAGCCTGDIDDPRDAILGAARYLVMRGAPADMQRALYGYNPSQPYVTAVRSYAENMMEDERAYLGYHAWQVIVSTSAGPVRLPIGFSAAEPVDASGYLAAHPEDAA